MAAGLAGVVLTREFIGVLSRSGCIDPVVSIRVAQKLSDCLLKDERKARENQRSKPPYVPPMYRQDLMARTALAPSSVQHTPPGFVGLLLTILEKKKNRDGPKVYQQLAPKNRSSAATRTMTTTYGTLHHMCSALVHTVFHQTSSKDSSSNRKSH